MAVAEVDKFPSSVLKHHYPTVPNLGDITKITEEQIKALGHIDVVVFGFPCQDLSIAGTRKGLKNETGEVTRSGLFFTAMQIVRWSGARWSLAENVPGIFSSKQGADFAAVVGEMAGAEPDVPKGGWQNTGFLLGPDGLVQWGTLDAQYFRVAQRRRRVFIIRDIGDWASTEPIFLEREGLLGHPAPSREKRQSTPGDAVGSSGSGDTGRVQSHWDGDNPHPTLNQCASSSGGVGSSNQEIFSQRGAYLVPDTLATAAYEVSPCLTSSGRGVERTGDTRGQDPLVDDHQGGRKWPADVATTLDTTFGDKQGLDNQHINGGGRYSSLSCWWDGGQVSQTLDAVLSKGQCMPEKNRFPAVLVPLEDYPVAFGGNNTSGPIEVTTAVNACSSATGRLDFESETFLVQERPLVFQSKASSTQSMNPSDICPTLDVCKSEGLAVMQKIREMTVQAFGFAQNSRDEVRLVGGDGSIAGALAAEAGMKQTTYVAIETPNAIGFQSSQSGVRLVDTHATLDANNGPRKHNGVIVSAPDEAPEAYGIRTANTSSNGWVIQEEQTHTLDRGMGVAVATRMAVRRLTPRECERLQGFPDDYTLIPSAKKVTKTPSKKKLDWEFIKYLFRGGALSLEECQSASADGPRYKSIGNSMAVPCMSWIGKRIQTEHNRSTPSLSQ